MPSHTNPLQETTAFISREGQKIYVYPVFLELKKLQTTAIETSEDQRRGFQLCRTRVPLYQLYSDSFGGEEIAFEKGLETAILSNCR
jgi:hypothetical protein